MDAKDPIPTDDLDSCARSVVRWKSGQPSIKGCILHISVGTSFWRIKRGLSDNASDFARRAHGAPRQGCALLAGLVVCGRCGYQMLVNTEMLVKLHRLGYKWLEVPVNHFPRAGGKASGANLRVILRAFTEFIGLYHHMKHEPL